MKSSRSPALKAPSYAADPRWRNVRNGSEADLVPAAERAATYQASLRRPDGLLTAKITHGNGRPNLLLSVELPCHYVDETLGRVGLRQKAPVIGQVLIGNGYRARSND